jgi:hypothetical protein
MSASPEIRNSSWRSWRFVVVSLLCTVVSIPIIGAFSVPWSFTYVQWPGTILAVVVACVCAACFISCPRKPLLPKTVAFILVVPAAMCAVDCVMYYYLYIQDMASRAILK